MKCPNCGNSIFPGQFRCEKCNFIISMAEKKEEPKEEQQKENKKEKE